MAWLFLVQFTNLFDNSPKKLLHFAPESHIEKKFRKIPSVDYISADIIPGRAMATIDIQEINFGDNTVDAIYCSHVLEHVPNDHLAMKELFRVLRPSGWLLVMVPIKGDVTFEDSSVTLPEDRAKLFGQSDHLRFYGTDISERLSNAGFDVSIYSSSDVVAPDKHDYYGLRGGRSGAIFFCQKKQK